MILKLCKFNILMSRTFVLSFNIVMSVAKEKHGGRNIFIIVSFFGKYTKEVYLLNLLISKLNSQ